MVVLIFRNGFASEIVMNVCRGAENDPSPTADDFLLRPTCRYDPYAAEEGGGGAAGADSSADGQNMYENMKGLLALAKMTHGQVHGGEEERGGWKG